jgi:hypothetical protein
MVPLDAYWQYLSTGSGLRRSKPSFPIGPPLPVYCSSREFDGSIGLPVVVCVGRNLLSQLDRRCLSTIARESLTARVELSRSKNSIVVFDPRNEMHHC